MKTNDNDDFLDQQIFEFVEKDKGVPLYVDKAIENAINRVNPTTKLVYKMRKIAIIIISLGIATTSVVFAKDIVNFFKAIFTNSTPGIDSAVKNGHAQRVDMDFVYNNDIGIKVNSVVKDENILDIAFVFDCPNEEDITNITLGNFEIFDENNEVLKLYNYDSDSKYINDENFNYTKAFEMTNDIKVIDSLYYKSILFRTKDILNLQNVNLKISQIKIHKKDNTSYIVNGNWNFNLYLDSKLTDISTNNRYNMKYDNNIVNVSNEINNTNFVINIEFLEDFDSLILTDRRSIILKDDLGNEFDISANYFYKENSIIKLEYDFGKYNLPNNLSLYIKYNENKDTLIEFYK